MKYCPECKNELITKRDENGQDRLGCFSSTCNFVFWNNPVPVVTAIVEHQGKIVLTRNHGWPPKWFGLVAGFLEKGETPEDGIIREIKEELNLEGKIDHFIGYYSFFKMNQLLLAFYVRAEGEIAISEELAEIKQVLPEKLRPWPFGAGLAVTDWIEKQNFASKVGTDNG